MNQEQIKDEPPPSVFARCRRLVRRVAQVVFLLGLAYALAALIGLIPVNRDFQPTAEGGIPIYVYSGAVHSDLILPVQSQHVDWRGSFDTSLFKKPIEDFSHVAIGWGDRGFYLETPKWSDLKASTVFSALFMSSDSVVHVHFMNKPRQSKICRQIVLSPDQYAALVEFINDSFLNSQIDHIEDEAYGNTDAFFEGQGSYHAFNTCNCWAANGLETAGVTVPFFAPLPRTILWYLPEFEESKKK